MALGESECQGVGGSEGEAVSFKVGEAEGTALGDSVGLSVGEALGESEFRRVGESEGEPEGFTVSSSKQRRPSFLYFFVARQRFFFSCHSQQRSFLQECLSCLFVSLVLFWQVSLPVLPHMSQVTGQWSWKSEWRQYLSIRFFFSRRPTRSQPSPIGPSLLVAPPRSRRPCTRAPP